MSVTMTGLSLGGVIIVPGESFLLRYFGLRGALPIFGLLLCIVIIPVTLFLVKKSPSIMGLFPDNTPPSHDDGQQTKAQLALSSQMTTWTRRQAMGTRAFWAIVLAFFL